MPRKPLADDHQWVSIDLPVATVKILQAAAKADDRSMNAYLKRVIAGHAALLQITDPETRAQLSNLGSLSAGEQLRVLENVRKRFQQEVVGKEAKGKGEK